MIAWCLQPDSEIHNLQLEHKHYNAWITLKFDHAS